MQVCSVTVSLGGDIRNTVIREGVTPAEIAVLNHIHGEGAVHNINPTHMDKRAHKEEKTRLTEKYKRHAKDIDGLFPGIAPKMPIKLRDIGIDMDAVKGADPAPEDQEPEEEPEKTSERAHNEDGTFKADDPKTPENEAFVKGGK